MRNCGFNRNYWVQLRLAIEINSSMKYTKSHRSGIVPMHIFSDATNPRELKAYLCLDRDGEVDYGLDLCVC